MTTPDGSRPRGRLPWVRRRATVMACAAETDRHDLPRMGERLRGAPMGSTGAGSPPWGRWQTVAETAGSVPAVVVRVLGAQAAARRCAAARWPG